VHNGLLLSALWDAAFDKGLVSFADDGMPITSMTLSLPARVVLAVDTSSRYADFAMPTGPILPCTVLDTDSDVSGPDWRWPYCKVRGADRMERQL